MLTPASTDGVTVRRLWESSRFPLILGAAILGPAWFGVLVLWELLFGGVSEDLDRLSALGILAAILLPCCAPLPALSHDRTFRLVTSASVLYGLIMSGIGFAPLLLPVVPLQLLAIFTPATPLARPRFRRLMAVYAAGVAGVALFLLAALDAPRDQDTTVTVPIRDEPAHRN